VFQPHLYSRTRDFCKEFGESFADADILVATDVYGARETPIPGVTGELVAGWAIRSGHTNTQYVPDKSALPAFLADLVAPNDMVITLGAGDIRRGGEALLSLLHAKDAHAGTSMVS